ncbi:MAG TPA: ABC transporter substrate-binding protein [Thermomicrobiales bacterium]|nr:ABC transporter substrate-binding protein [Thermomicrobiales bacterium]
MFLRAGAATAAAAVVTTFPRHGRQQTETATSSTSQSFGGDPVVALAHIPDGNDLVTGATAESIWLGGLCHDTLFMPDTNGDPAPGIAVAPFFNREGFELDFSVREGVIFPDGSLLTAEDVVASLERIRGMGPNSAQGWRLEHIDAIEIPEPGTVRLTLTQPDYSLLGCLGSSTIPVLPRDIASDLGTYGLPNLPPGTGPFVPGSIPDAETYEFGRNGSFWQIGRPRLDGLTVTSVTEDTQRTISLVTGSVDIVIDAPLLDIKSLKQDPNITLVGGPSVRACVVILNVVEGGMADRRVRKLLSEAINRSALVQAATGGEGSPEQTLFPKATWPGLDQPPPDTDWDKTRKDMMALGYTAGLPLRLITSEQDGSSANAAVLLQEQLGNAGFSVTLDLLDAAALERTLTTRQYDLYIMNTPGWTDPHELVRPLLMSDGPGNLMGYRSARVDSLIRQAVMVETQDDRATIYQQLQTVLLDEVPLIVLFFPNYYDAMSARVKDYGWYPPVHAYGLRTAWMEPPTPSS